MTTPILSTAPVSVALVRAGDVIRYAGGIYRISEYVPFSPIDGGVLLANSAAEGGAWCPQQVALPFPNTRSDVDLVTGGAR